jgi:hypothetical protein
MNKGMYDKILREEGIDPREEERRLTALFAQIDRVVKSLPGVMFYHLQAGELGKLKGNRVEWNAWLYVREQDRVFPFRCAIEPGRHSQFRLRIHPDLEVPNDTTVLSALREVMREQMTGVDSMYLRLRYWNDNKEEPVFARAQRGS